MDSSISYFKTEKGSVYLHLEDGRIQRFKSIKRKLQKPQALTVFLPNYEFVKKNAPKSQLEKLGENEEEYLKNLSYAVYKSKGKVHIVNEGGKQIEDNKTFSQTKERSFFRFSENGKSQFYIPVKGTPEIEMIPYESTLEEENGIWYRTKHLGHKIIEIEKSKPNLINAILEKKI